MTVPTHDEVTAARAIFHACPHWWHLTAINQTVVEFHGGNEEPTHPAIEVCTACLAHRKTHAPVTPGFSA